jgi:hypothetical protein
MTTEPKWYTDAHGKELFAVWTMDPGFVMWGDTAGQAEPELRIKAQGTVQMRPGLVATAEKGDLREDALIDTIRALSEQDMVRSLRAGVMGDGIKADADRDGLLLDVSADMSAQVLKLKATRNWKELPEAGVPLKPSAQTMVEEQVLALVERARIAIGE